MYSLYTLVIKKLFQSMEERDQPSGKTQLSFQSYALQAFLSSPLWCFLRTVLSQIGTNNLFSFRVGHLSRHLLHEDAIRETKGTDCCLTSKTQGSVLFSSQAFFARTSDIRMRGALRRARGTSQGRSLLKLPACVCCCHLHFAFVV